MAENTIKIVGAGGAEFTVTTDPDNWYHEHLERQLASGEVKAVTAKAAPKAAARDADAD